MIQKLLLTIIIIMVGLLIFLTNKISSNIDNLTTGASGQGEISPASTNFSQNSLELPMLWDVIKDKSVKKVYLSYDKSRFTEAMEIVRLLEKNGLISIYLVSSDRNANNDYSLKADDETMRALKSMDVFAVLYTPEYKEERINNQEYGVALARGVKVITITSFPVDSNFYSDGVITFNSENTDNLQTDFLNSLNTKVISDFQGM